MSRGGNTSLESLTPTLTLTLTRVLGGEAFFEGGAGSMAMSWLSTAQALLEGPRKGSVSGSTHA